MATDTVSPEIRTEYAGLGKEIDTANAGLVAQGQEDVSRAASQKATMDPLNARFENLLAEPRPQHGAVAPLPAVPTGDQINVNPKEYESFSFALLGMALIGGAVSHGNWLGASAALNGALRGFREGNHDKAAAAWDDYKAKFGAAVADRREADRQYDEALNNRKLTINEQLAQIENVGRQFHDADMVAAAKTKSLQAVVNQKEAKRTALLGTLQKAQAINIRVDAGIAARNAKEVEGTMQPDELQFTARQYLAGDKTVMQNLGRGAQGARNVIAMRRTIMNEARASGMSPADVAMKLAEFSGLQSGERTLGVRTAQVGLAVNEAKKMAPLLLAASAAVPRTEFPKWNAVELAFEKGTGDPNVVKLAAALNSYVNIYARAISPIGSGTISDKEHAREVLEINFSEGQMAAAVEQLGYEMEAAKAAPEMTKQDLRDLHGGTAPKDAPFTQDAIAAELKRRAAGH